MSTIEVYRGDSYPRTYTVRNRDGSTVDITGWTITLTVNQLENPTPADTPEFSVTATLTDAANGVFQVKPSTVQNDLEPRTYYYDIAFVNGVDVLTLVKGKYIVTMDVGK